MYKNRTDIVQDVNMEDFERDALSEKLIEMQYDLNRRFEKIEATIAGIQKALIKLEGATNPPHRPQKELSTEYIIDQVKHGKSARTIADMLNVRPNTVTKRLKDAGYVSYRGKWVLTSEKPQTKPMTEEEKAEVLKKLKH